MARIDSYDGLAYSHALDKKKEREREREKNSPMVPTVQEPETGVQEPETGTVPEQSELHVAPEFPEWDPGMEVTEQVPKDDPKKENEEPRVGDVGRRLSPIRSKTSGDEERPYRSPSEQMSAWNAKRSSLLSEMTRPIDSPPTPNHADPSNTNVAIRSPRNNANIASATTDTRGQSSSDTRGQSSSDTRGQSSSPPRAHFNLSDRPSDLLPISPLPKEAVEQEVEQRMFRLPRRKLSEIQALGPPLIPPGGASNVGQQLHDSLPNTGVTRDVQSGQGRAFSGSVIVDSETSSLELIDLLPYEEMPRTVLLYSTIEHGYSIEEFHLKSDQKGPTLLIAQVGDNIFGGYAGTSWNQNATRFGTPRSFLYSLTHGRVLKYQGGDVPGACCLWAGADAITFGMSDLYFRDDFRSCGSVLETCYGIGSEDYPKSETPTTLLAGSQEFGHATTGLILEVWGFEL